MYEILLISADKNFTNTALKFIPHINGTIQVSTATNVKDGVTYLEKEDYTDLVVIDHDVSVDVFDLMNSMGRISSGLPIILLSRNPTPELLSGALNTHVDFFLARGNREPMEFFTELDQKIVMAAERQRNEIQRRINEKRMEALVQMAMMSDQEFQKVVHYAVDKSIELTKSKIGYVSLYDKDSRILRMMAWSTSAMRNCAVGSFSFEFDLDSTGIWGEPIRSGKTIIVNDYDGDPRLMKKGLPIGHVSLNKLLMVPIYLNGELIGTAGVGNKERDYTWFDEVQVMRLMEEMFSIHSKLEEFKKNRGQVSVIRDLLDSGPYGFMFVTIDLNVVILNKFGANIVGCAPVRTSFVPLENIRTPAIDQIRAAINSSRLYSRDETIRIHVSDGEKDRTFEATIMNMVSPDRQNPGFAITMMDVTDLQNKDDLISRAVDHIRIVEGPVNRYALKLVQRMLASPECTGDLRKQTLRLRESADFIRDFRYVGVKQPTWMEMEEILVRALKTVDTPGISVITRIAGIRIFADPAFPAVFRHLISNTVIHAGGASEIEIGFKIHGGNLTIIYTDDGCGISNDIRERIFDGADEGWFGLFLVNHICQASGFKVTCPETSRGSRFEISIPASKYTME